MNAVIIELRRTWNRQLTPPVGGIVFDGQRIESLDKEQLIKALYYSVETSEEWKQSYVELKSAVRQQSSGLRKDHLY